MCVMVGMMIANLISCGNDDVYGDDVGVCHECVNVMTSTTCYNNDSHSAF